MAMTFLQLVNRLRQKVGITGNDLTTLSNLSGESLRCKNWVNEAWIDIQEQHPDWNWLRTTVSFATVDGQAVYTPTDCGIAATLGTWKKDSFRIYVTANGFVSETFLGDMLYDNWRDIYQFGALRTTTTRPVFISVAPNRSLCFGPAPDALGYTVVGDYYLAPSEMAADSDVPTLPERFQMAIVYRAMMSYAGFESAPEVYQDGQTEFNRMMRRLELDQQPQMLVGEPLA